MKQLKSTLTFITVSIFLFSCGGVSVKKDESTKLKKLTEYNVSAFKLTKDVSYFEIQSYDTFGAKNNLRFLPSLGVGRTKVFFDKSAYQSLTKKEKNKVNIASPVLPKSDHFGAWIAPPMTRNSGTIVSISNLHYLDKKSNLHTVSNTSGVMDLLGTIDTPAEIQLVLWMNKEKHAKSYKKVDNTYEIITNYTIGVTHVEPCGTYTYRLIMDLNGKIIKKKLLKYKKLKYACPIV